MLLLLLLLLLLVLRVMLDHQKQIFGIREARYPSCHHVKSDKEQIVLLSVSNSTMPHAAISISTQKESQFFSHSHLLQQFQYCYYNIVDITKSRCLQNNSKIIQGYRIHLNTRMWANAQRDGRPVEYRWRSLFNAAVWLTPTTRVPCSKAAKTRNPLKLPGVPPN